MGLYFSLDINDDCRLGCWKIEESNDWMMDRLNLPQDDLNELDSFRSEQRKRHWLATRVLLEALHPGGLRIEHSPIGAPYIPNGPNISISHSGEFVAIITNERQVPGIDIEQIKPRIERITDKFLSDREKLKIDPIHKEEMLHLFWGSQGKPV